MAVVWIHLWKYDGTECILVEGSLHVPTAPQNSAALSSHVHTVEVREGDWNEPQAKWSLNHPSKRAFLQGTIPL